MANFAVDPRPHVPMGFNLLDVDYAWPFDRPRAFLGALTEKCNENVAIATIIPSVDKADFQTVASELRRVMQQQYRVINLEIQPSPIGDVFVTFNSPLQRQRFLESPPMNVDQYTVRFERHDEVANVHSVDIDREVWLMLLCYPLDARSPASIAKSISSFARCSCQSLSQSHGS